MATLQSIGIDDVVSIEVKKALSIIKPKVDLNDLLSSIIAGCMKYLYKGHEKGKGREYVCLMKKDVTSYYMTLMHSKYRPSLCGKMFLTNSKYYTIPLHHPEIFKGIIEDLEYYCDIDKTLTIKEPPFTVNGINVLEEVIQAFFIRITQEPKVITTFSGYSLICTSTPYSMSSVIEIYKS